MLKDLFKKKSVISIKDNSNSLDNRLALIAKDIVEKNMIIAIKYLGIDNTKFQVSLEKLDGNGAVGFTDDKKINGKVNVRLFYNKMYEQAINTVCLPQYASYDPIFIYKVIVAEIIVHELTHVRQYLNNPEGYVLANIEACEKEALEVTNAFATNNLYKL